MENEPDTSTWSVMRVCLAIVTLLVSPSVQAGVYSRFDRGLPDWTTVVSDDPGTLTRNWRSGNPLGHLEVNDTVGPNTAISLRAPNKFHGDLSDMHSLGFDARLLSGSGVRLSQFGTVTIRGGGRFATLDLAPTSLGSPSGPWQTFQARLDAATWGKSQNEWNNLISSVSDITLNVEEVSGATEIVGIDNLYVQQDPFLPVQDRARIHLPPPSAGIPATVIPAQLESEQWLSQTGYYALYDHLAGGMPAGRGVTVAQIETRHPTPDSFPDVSIRVLGSYVGPVGGHADVVAGYLYSQQEDYTPTSYRHGWSPGVTDAHSWTAHSFATDVLHIAGSQWNGVLPAYPAGEFVPEVMNMSNAFRAGGSEAFQRVAIRAFDYFIADNNTLFFSAARGGDLDGLNSTASSLYNGIVVGMNLEHPNYPGGTIYDNHSGPRPKPDVVTSTGDSLAGRASSFATPVVATLGAMLLEAADVLGYADGRRNVVVKSLIMAGATKENLGGQGEFVGHPQTDTWNFFPDANRHRWTNAASPGMGFDFYTDTPLDTYFGAGLINGFNSYQILESGEYCPCFSTEGPAPEIGWDFGETAGAGATNEYIFDITSDGAVGFSAILTWNREVIPNSTSQEFESLLVDLDLTLQRIGDNPANIAFSDDSGGNVEHIFLPGGLSPGRYALSVVHGLQGDLRGIEYGLAWRTISVPEPSTLAAVIVGTLVSLHFRRRLTST